MLHSTAWVAPQSHDGELRKTPLISASGGAPLQLKGKDRPIIELRQERGGGLGRRRD
jgi:hypothetical protein